MNEKATQNARLNYLVEEFKEDSVQYKDLQTPKDTEGKRRILRSLMNVRMPRKMDEAVLAVQDEYLQERIRENGIVEPAAIHIIRDRMSIWQGDITRLAVDAIVNAANSQMLGCFVPMHTCIDNIIHSKAGLSLRFKCNCIMRAQGHEEPTGKAKITPAYNLPCKYVIHTVGPIVQGSLTKRHEELLASCYRSCLDIAEENNVESIALCCISTGVFMFPNQRAAEIAVDTVKAWLAETGSQMKVVFNVYKDLDLEIYSELLQ